MLGISTEPLYNYYLGRGGWGSTKISIEKFEQFCRIKLGTKLIRNFLESEGTLIEQEKYLSAWEKHVQNDCCLVCGKRIPPEYFKNAIKILYRYFDKKTLLNILLSVSRSYINWAANLEKTNKNLLLQLNDENKTARIKELQDWSEEQLKAKEWFLSQIKYKDERIAKLEKVSGFCYKILSRIFRILRGKV